MDEILKLFGGAENIWAAIQQNASEVGIEATRVMLELFYVLKSPNTSMMNKTIIVVALGYQLLPEDVFPRDEYGWLGFLDNGAALALAYNRVKSSVTPEIEQQVNNVLINWFGTDGNEQMIIGDNPSDYPLPTIKGTDNPMQNPPASQPSQPRWNDNEDVVID